MTTLHPKIYTGTLYIISAPSGAGKSSLIKAYLQQQTEHKAKVAISHTTRDKRPGEINNEHYHFVTKSIFEEMITHNAFLEYAKVYENYYGTSMLAIEDDLINGIDVFLDIDWQGAQQVRKKMPSAKSIFILPPSIEELERRLFTRGQDSEDTIKKRMQKAQAEMSHYNEYDYVIINDDFDQSLNQLMAIMLSERLSTEKQTNNHKQLIMRLFDTKTAF